MPPVKVPLIVPKDVVWVVRVSVGVWVWVRVHDCVGGFRDLVTEINELPVECFIRVDPSLSLSCEFGVQLDG